MSDRQPIAAKPLVGVIMGSKSDWETMRHAAETLTKFWSSARVPGCFRRIDTPASDGRVRASPAELARDWK